MNSQMTFGLKDQVPRDAKVAWGARLIIQESHAYKQYIRRGKGRRPKQFAIDFLCDRQSFMGEDRDIQAFKKALSKGGKKMEVVFIELECHQTPLYRFSATGVRSGFVVFRPSRSHKCA